MKEALREIDPNHSAKIGSGISNSEIGTTPRTAPPARPGRPAWPPGPGGQIELKCEGEVVEGEPLRPPEEPVLKAE